MCGALTFLQLSSAKSERRLHVLQTTTYVLVIAGPGTLLRAAAAAAYCTRFLTCVCSTIPRPTSRAHFRSSPRSSKGVCELCLSHYPGAFKIYDPSSHTQRARHTSHTRPRSVFHPHLAKLRPAHPSSCPTPVFTLFSEHTIPLYPHVCDRERAGQGAFTF